MKILRYSSWPGISRHHWGTDIDFNAVNFEYWYSPTGKKTYRWLQENAGKYGFCEPYSGKRNGGYENEPWHWSYKKIAYPLQLQREQELRGVLQTNVLGAHLAVKQENLLMTYVKSVSQTCIVK